MIKRFIRFKPHDQVEITERQAISLLEDQVIELRSNVDPEFIEYQPHPACSIAKTIVRRMQKQDRILNLLEEVRKHVEHMEENLAGHTDTDVCVWLRQAIALVKEEE